MNHCTECGRHISVGVCYFRATTNGRCLICLTAERLRNWRYVSPAARRRNKTKETK